MYKSISIIHIPAIASVSGWVRCAKTVHISESTPKWMVDIISDLRTHSYGRKHAISVLKLA